MSIDAEILDGFREETGTLISELQDIVSGLERKHSEFPKPLLEDFAQRIDRVMGAAKTLALMDEANASLIRIGALAELCKRIGYRAAVAGKTALLPVYAAFLGDTIDAIEEMMEALDDAEAATAAAKGFAPVLQKRLEWLLQKTGDGSIAQNQAEVDELLKQLA